MANFTQFISDHIKSDFRGMNWITYKDGGVEMYISFQVLLKFINENLNLFSSNHPIVKIDWQSDKPFYALSCHISTDLTVCYLYNEFLKIEDGSTPNPNIATFHPFTNFSNTEEGNLFTVVNANLKTDSGISFDSNNYVYPQVGNINYIYLNVGYLSKIIADNLDKENKISMGKFFQIICDDLNKALGGINDFQVVINSDEIPNTLTIIDVNQNRIKELKKVFEPEQSLTTIQAQGIGLDNNNKGTFVKNIRAESSITPEIASSISIGAQANGNQIGEDATSFSRLSRGIIDRIYPVKNTAQTQNIVNKPIKERFESNIESFKQLIVNLQNSTDYKSAQIYIKLSDENNNGPIISDLFKAIVGEFTEKNMSNPTFIPIKLELEVLGISGIRIFEQFQLSSDVLPLSYQNDFNFIVTGVSHEINTHKWVTKIAALTYLKEQPISIPTNNRAIDLELSTITNPTPLTQNSKPKSNLQLSRGSVISSKQETIDFLVDVLKRLGISNPNNNQISFMTIWRQHEGGKAAWNPFNTTLFKRNSTPYNDVLVRNYPNRQTGIDATVETLLSPRYSNVVKAIKEIKPGDDTFSKDTINKAMEAVNKSPWGSKFNPVNWRSWGTLNNYIAQDPVIPRSR